MLNFSLAASPVLIAAKVPRLAMKSHNGDSGSFLHAMSGPHALGFRRCPKKEAIKCIDMHKATEDGDEAIVRTAPLLCRTFALIVQ
eukprot:2250442-Pleurochrysis_carterae.AAC.1